MRTIKSKINTAFSILIALAFISMGLYLFNYFSNFYLENLEDQLVNKAKMISHSIKDSELAGDALQEYVVTLGTDTGFRFTVVNNDGTVLAESEKNPEVMDNHLDRPEIKKAYEEGTGLHTRYSNTIDEDLLYAAVPIYNEEIGNQDNKNRDDLIVNGFARVAFPLTEIQSVRNHLGVIIGSGTLLALLFTWLFGSLIAQSITYPLEVLSKWTGQVSKGDFSEDKPINSKDEIGELSHRFHQMKNNLSTIMSQLTEEKNRLSTLLNNMPDGVIEINHKSEVTLINPAARSFLNINAYDSVDQQELVSLTRNFDLNNAVTQVLKSGEQVSRETDFNNQIVRMYVTPLPLFEEGSRGAVVILQDITDLTKLEQMRKEFISNISHELKTPLTSIKGFVETLKEETLGENNTQREFLNIIEEETDRVSRLINDLTILSRLETNKVEFNQDEVNVLNFLDKTVSISQKRWQQDGYRIYRGGVPFDLKALMDEDKIQQVILNLVDNACRHNPPGTKIKLKAVSEKDYIRFSVTDNGKGIPEEDKERIFERFYRVDKSRYRDYGGTGLGLSIAKHAVIGHNSSLNVISRVGRGTTFYFYVKRILD
ncbi:HAMP domain-containing sensor histidine kinase [Natranaerobius thermophilus]|uniref:histidine kinase n=1 Tax=Natranaerobius thermophilus (strain ATCC BAA-1301 / DSM 18059 / JW/NM-WN-LF) TaxID=457570 RepID=B2A0K8_NATTJ|nr:ATP-binding protein [Natranaerobius thermophilus]ACB84569.1 multi-sensor signal transduction histidine kinase [Natranaerobius thermophilus JW/NM-WN-LF]